MCDARFADGVYEGWLHGRAVWLCIRAAMYCLVSDEECSDDTCKVGGSQAVVFFWVCGFACFICLVQPGECGCRDGAHGFHRW